MTGEDETSQFIFSQGSSFGVDRKRGQELSCHFDQQLGILKADN